MLSPAMAIHLTTITVANV